MKQHLDPDGLYLRASITQRSWRNFWMGKPSIAVAADSTIKTNTYINGNLVISDNVSITVTDGVSLKVMGKMIFKSRDSTVITPNGELK